MNGLTRALVADLQPGDVVRTHRTALPYTVVSTLLEHGASWRVLGHDGITRHYAARATVLAGGPRPLRRAVRGGVVTRPLARRRRGGGGLAAAVLVVAVAAAGSQDGVAAQAAPSPVGVERLAASELYRLAVAAGLAPDAAVTATAVALAESGGDVDVAGDEGLVDGVWGPSVGLWQIRCRHADVGAGGPRDCSRLADPAFNAAAMAAISGGGTSWAPWSAYTSGAYTGHLGAAESAAWEAGR